ncbi:hypothetical protein AVEN_109447-1 [Araneus ventricosus]|uniref:RNase H type-1 domain-containing protein n=1 Tax=Araneus ventricosus TaxID=182803 RepID=A0A4Y2SYY1_ARAVE|nr:hypothetical protein AVEN_109447-1 [Araneus ventricosus]
MNLKRTEALAAHIAFSITMEWQGKLDRINSVFQAEFGFPIRMAIEAAFSLRRSLKIWTDCLSSLMAILNPKSHHSMFREIQTLLLSHKYIHLRWINPLTAKTANTARHANYQTTAQRPK